jgi:hypothetical protein
MGQAAATVIVASAQSMLSSAGSIYKDMYCFLDVAVMR